MKIFKALITSLLGISLVNSKLVMIIRHGEKIDDDHTDLSPIGQARAECLVESFGKNGTFTTPEKIYAQSLVGKKSTRPRDTVVPLAKNLGLDINLDYEADDVTGLFLDIKRIPEKVILISWSNDKIKKIAKKFGIKDVEDWGSNVFNEIYAISDGSPDYLQDRAGATAQGIVPIYERDGKESYKMTVIDENVEKCIQRTFPDYSQADGAGSLKANIITFVCVIVTLLYFLY